MGTLFSILILAGAVLALVAAIGALRAYLRLRRARAALQNNLTEEVDRLSRRTGELEETLTTLDARAQQLPIQIAELQQSLSTLRVLTEALAATLRQAPGSLLQRAQDSERRPHRRPEPVPPGAEERSRLGLRVLVAPRARIILYMGEEQTQQQEVHEPSGEDCEICGSEMYGLHCKLVCPNCGFRRDCSDP